MHCEVSTLVRMSPGLPSGQEKGREKQKNTNKKQNIKKWRPVMVKCERIEKSIVGIKKGETEKAQENND